MKRLARNIFIAIIYAVYVSGFNAHGTIICESSTMTSEAPASPEGGYRVYANSGQMGKLAPIYAYIYPTATENTYAIQGLYADIVIFIDHNPETGELTFPKQKFMIDTESYDFLPVVMNLNYPYNFEYLDEITYKWDTDADGMEAYFPVIRQDQTDILVFNYHDWYEYSPYTSEFDRLVLEPLDKYFEKTKIVNTFSYDPNEWRSSGSATLSDCWLPSSLEDEPVELEVACEINRYNPNLILLKNPYGDLQSSVFSPEENGYIVIDLEDPNCVKLMPTVSSGINAKKARVDNCLPDETLCMYNLAGHHYYLSLASDAPQALEDYINNPSSCLSTFDGETIHVNDYCFATNKTNLFEARTWDENARKGSIRLSQKTIEDITTGMKDLNQNCKDPIFEMLDGILSIRGLNPNDNVSIYSLTGQNIFNGDSSQSTFSITLPTGIYLLKINSVTTKIII